jgi:glycine cleavage system aminomethyltransferase T
MERRSALHGCHLGAGAQLDTFFGWQLPASYTDASSELAQVRTSVGISDASYLFKLDVKFDVRGPVPEALSGRVWKLTPTHSLITSPQPVDFTPSSLVTDVTSVYSVILLAGPKSRETLQKLTTLNVSEAAMPAGDARLTRLAHVNAIILHDKGFLILNTRDVAEHVWQALLHAGASPFGVLAQQQWWNHASA